VDGIVWNIASSRRMHAGQTPLNAHIIDILLG
jgi:hypothetical protein